MNQNNELEVNELARRVIGAEMEPVIKVPQTFKLSVIQD